MSKINLKIIGLKLLFEITRKTMTKRLTQFIERNKILSNHQYGFRENRSTEHAVIDFVDRITQAIEQGKFSVGIFLDLSKAFDTINHRILIRKVEHYGTRRAAKIGLRTTYLT